MCALSSEANPDPFQSTELRRDATVKLASNGKDHFRNTAADEL